MEPIPPNERLVPVYVGDEMIFVSPPEYYRYYGNLVQKIGAIAIDANHDEV